MFSVRCLSLVVGQKAREAAYFQATPRVTRGRARALPGKIPLAAVSRKILHTRRNKVER
jgi:hypothetical protein